MIDTYGNDPEGVGDTPIIVTVGFPDGDETFHDTDLRAFSKVSYLLGYVRQNWKNGAKELGA